MVICALEPAKSRKIAATASARWRASCWFCCTVPVVDARPRSWIGSVPARISACTSDGRPW
jgi:hypothetical protein